MARGAAASDLEAVPRVVGARDREVVEVAKLDPLERPGLHLRLEHLARRRLELDVDSRRPTQERGRAPAMQMAAFRDESPPRRDEREQGEHCERRTSHAGRENRQGAHRS